MIVSSPSYTSSKCRVTEEPTKAARGIVATETIFMGELICMFGGWIVDQETLASLPKKEQEHTLQVAEGFFLSWLAVDESSNYFNHSCSPNAGFNGQIALVAMRDIAADEEVTFDYAMCDGSPYDEFICLCGSDNCRGKVTGNDWENPDLWKRYNGYFSPYLQGRIRHEQERRSKLRLIQRP